MIGMKSLGLKKYISYNSLQLGIDKAAITAVLIFLMITSIAYRVVNITHFLYQGRTTRA